MLDIHCEKLFFQSIPITNVGLLIQIRYCVIARLIPNFGFYQIQYSILELKIWIFVLTYTTMDYDHKVPILAFKHSDIGTYIPQNGSLFLSL